MTYTPHAKPYVLDLNPVENIHDLKHLPSILKEGDFMLAQLYKDLKLVAADIITTNTAVASAATKTTPIQAILPWFDTDSGDESAFNVPPGGISSVGGPFTNGSVMFAGPGGILAQDNAKFFWDDVNFRHGIGTALPVYDLDVSSAAAGGTIIRTNNTSSTGTANFYMSNDSAHFILFQIYGSAFAGTLYGLNKAELGLFEYQGTNAFTIGTSGATPIVFGTNRIELARFTSSGFFGINTTGPLYKLHVVGPGGAVAGGLAALITDNNSHDGMNLAIGWTGAGANNKYKAFNIDSNGFHIGHMTDALNAAPTLDFTITNAGVCIAVTEMQSPLYDFGASTAHIKGISNDTVQFLNTGETGLGALMLGKNDTTGMQVQVNASVGLTLVNGNNSLFGRFTCNDLKLNPVTFANLPAAPGKGEIQPVTDSTVNTFGSTIAGGGANNVLAWFNGTNWTVIGI